MLEQTQTTVVSFLLDETGSMQPIRDETISGFNEYIDILKTNEFSTRLNLMSFNTGGFRLLYDDTDIDLAHQLTQESYQPDNLTNLYDAIAKLIKQTDRKIKNISPKPEVIFTILTDGLENASRSYSREKIFKLISEKEKEGWSFVYLGANQDSWEVVESIGVPTKNSADYSASRPDVALRTAGRATKRYMDNAPMRRVSSRSDLFDKEFFTESEKELMKSSERSK